MAKKIICPGCLSDMVSESVGWRCKNCRGFISLQDGKFYEYVENPFMPPMTNADRIRAMSDEELAKFVGEEGFHCEICSKGVNSECDLRCSTYCLEWLQQPVKETDNA